MDKVTYENFEWSPDDNEKFRDTDSIHKSDKRVTFRPPKESRIIYTDGGSRILTLDDGKKFYLGAWAFYDTETGEVIGKAEEKSTNNQMELLACIRALEHLEELGYPKTSWITVKLDSDYVRLGMIFWIKKWKSQNWTRTDKEGNSGEIKNVDLWKRLNELAQGKKIYWEHVDAHSGEEGNEKVDLECFMKMDEYMDKHGLSKKKK